MFKLLLRRILIPWLFWADRSKKGAALGWAGLGWAGGCGWGLWAGWSGWLGCGLFGAWGWGWGYSEAEIGLFEDGKVVSKSKKTSFRMANSNKQFLFISFLRAYGCQQVFTESVSFGTTF